MSLKSALILMWSLTFYFSMQNCSSFYISDINSTDITTAVNCDVTSTTWIPCSDDVEDVYPPNKYSFFVRVKGFGASCGGSLITSQYVLSAAQCLPKSAEKDETGRVDSATIQGFVVYVDVFNKSDEQNVYPVDAMIQFLGYDNNDNADILLIKLWISVDYSKQIKPINLPFDPRLEEPGAEAIVIGWNLTATGSCPENEALKEAKLIVLDPSTCNKYYDISQFTFCAGYPEIGACLGDIGGPVFIEKDNKYYIIGIVSVPGICVVNPGRYTKVSLFNTWIARNIRKLT